MRFAIESAGFRWLEADKVGTLWERTLTPEMFRKEMNIIAFESPQAIYEVYSAARPIEQRAFHNWVTIFIGARKPEA